MNDRDLFGNWDDFPMPLYTRKPKARFLTPAGWVLVFLAIAIIALGAGFALIPNIAEAVQL